MLDPNITPTKKAIECFEKKVNQKEPSTPFSVENRANLPDISEGEENILSVLVTHPLYGLEISRAISCSTASAQVLKIGSLYSLLHSLEEKGLVTSWMSEKGAEKRGGNRRKYYQVTSRGLGTLARMREIGCQPPFQRLGLA
jgi:PadR family transcriptional regulator, regulatory protein PadR